MTSITQENTAEKVAGLISDLNLLNERIAELDVFKKSGVLTFEEKIELWHKNMQWVSLTGQLNNLIGFGGATRII